MSDKKRVYFSVNEELIVDGDVCSCSTCPVALVIGQKLSEKVRLIMVIGRVADVYLHNQEVPIQFSLPLRVQKFIEDFDNFRAVKPFRFSLRLPKAILKA
jgi:hypothetical protein